MPFVTPNTPNLADFTTYVYDQGIPTAALPSNSDYLTYAFNYSQNVALQPAPSMAGIVFVMASYNLGMHHLLEIAPDQTGQTWFASARSQYQLLLPKVGVVSSGGDQGTSDTLVVPDFFKDMTLFALGLMKTPWGRRYLDYAQMYGSNIVGLS